MGCWCSCAVQYYDDAAGILRSIVLSAIAPHRLATTPPQVLVFPQRCLQKEGCECTSLLVDPPLFTAQVTTARLATYPPQVPVHAPLWPAVSDASSGMLQSTLAVELLQLLHAARFIIRLWFCSAG